MTLLGRRRLPRRTLLRGAGAALALPVLEAMRPARAARGTRATPRRLVVVYVPNGIIMKDWKPEATGRDFALPRILQPLRALRADFTVVSGLANLAASRGRGGGHAKASGSFLSGASIKFTAGPDVRAGVTFDQLVAQRWAGQTRVPSLQLGCEDARMVGNCDTGSSCAYTNTLSWKAAEAPLAVEVDPRSVFERLFGTIDPSLPAAVRRRRALYRKSILDDARTSTQALLLELGPADRHKMDEYLTGVREVEARIAAAEADPVTPVIEKPAGIPFEYASYVRLMFDLQVVAFQADLTRVCTMMLGREGSVRTYPEIGVPDPHHPLTHHRGHPDFIEKVTRINCLHVELLAHFLRRLAGTREAEGTLLAHSAILYGSALSDGNAHSNVDLPLLVAGHAGGLRGGQHVAAPANTPAANLFVELLDAIGVPAPAFADSSGRLDLRAGA